MLLTPGRRRQRSPPSHPRLGQTGFRKWSRSDEELRGGLCTPQSAASQARVRNLHLLPEPGTPPPDSPPGGARPEGEVRVWHWALRSAAPLAGGRARVSLWVAESPWCGQGTHVAFGEAPRRPTGHQDRVGATGAGQLKSVSCSSRPPANAQNTSPASFTPRGPETGDRAGGCAPEASHAAPTKAHMSGANRNGKHSVARKSLRDAHPERRK